MSLLCLVSLLEGLLTSFFLWQSIMRKCTFAMWFLVSDMLKTTMVQMELECEKQFVCDLYSKYDRSLISV